jgi:LmbE family N-acetylglucosaminyl deacetylase
VVDVTGRAVAAASARARQVTDLRGLGTLLAVFAHPDDETMLAGGLMRLLAGAGHRVVCLTATRGERGTDDPAQWPAHRLARRRTRELRLALGRLGVTEQVFLGHPAAGSRFTDGTLHRVPAPFGVAAVAEVMAEVAPDTVVTFGPDGFTGHLDHRRIGAWTTAAFGQAAPTGARLLHVTRSRRWWTDGPGGWIDVRMDRDDPTLPHGVDEDELAIDLQLEGEDLRHKVAALMAHRSQVAPLLHALGRDRFRDWFATEQFVLAATRTTTRSP